MKSSKQQASFLVCAALIAFASSATFSKADTLAYSYPPAPDTNIMPTPTPGSAGETDLAAYGISGFEFAPTLNISVTSLGFTALSLGGGDTPQVTLWQVGSGGALSQVATTGTLPAADYTSEPSNNQSAALSFINITPVTLTAGSTYLVTAPAYWAATFPSADISANADLSSTSFVKGGGWNGWANSSYSVANISSFSTASSSATPVEADFQFTPIASPEPSAYLMLGMGLSLLMLLRRRATGASR